MQHELITLFGRIRVPDDSGGTISARKINAFTAEAALYGYSFDAGLRSRLARLSSGAFDQLRKEVLDALRVASGDNVRHVALFNKFPYETPDKWDYLVRRMLGFLQTEHHILPNEAQVLSCGHILDFRLFDKADFSACPICQFQVEELDAPEEDVRHPYRRITPLKLLGAIDDDGIRAKASQLLARQSSLSEAERRFLGAARILGGLARPAAVYRENLPFVYAFFPDPDYLEGLLSGPADILRIAAYLSDDAADLSLAAPVRFRIATRHKKALLRLLDGLSDPAGDMLRHRERWLRLGEILNPGTRTNRRRFPNAARAFDALRNAPKRIRSHNRTLEKKIRARKIDAELLALLSERPGELFRRLDFLLRSAGRTGRLFETLEAAARKVPGRILFTVRKHLRRRSSPVETRVFLPKGWLNKMQLRPDTRAPIPAARLEKAIRLIDAEIARRLEKLPALGRVWVDPDLRNVVLPWNRRGDSATSKAVPKGTRFPLAPSAPVVRLFVWWRGTVDVDLSIMCYDEAFSPIAGVSWVNASAFKCIHSGDIQNAPNGASEFIDFEIEDLLKRNVRYVVASVLSYRGEGFDEFPCFAGFMERDALKSGRKFEPESVALKFALGAKTRSYMPLVFDLETREAVFADLATGGGWYQRMDLGNSKFAALAKATLELPETKPTAFDVLAAHAAARGTPAPSREEADLVFARDTLDLDRVAAMMDEGLAQDA